jgi:hypothetical protein
MTALYRLLARTSCSICSGAGSFSVMISVEDIYLQSLLGRTQDPRPAPDTDHQQNNSPFVKTIKGQSHHAFSYRQPQRLQHQRTKRERHNRLLPLRRHHRDPHAKKTSSQSPTATSATARIVARSPVRLQISSACPPRMSSSPIEIRN